MSNDGLEEVRKIVRFNQTDPNAPSDPTELQYYTPKTLGEIIRQKTDEKKAEEKETLLKGQTIITELLAAPSNGSNPTMIKRIGNYLKVNSNQTPSVNNDLETLQTNIIEQLPYYEGKEGGKRKRRRTKKSKHNKRKRTNRRRR